MNAWVPILIHISLVNLKLVPRAKQESDLGQCPGGELNVFHTGMLPVLQCLHTRTGVGARLYCSLLMLAESPRCHGSSLPKLFMCQCNMH